MVDEETREQIDAAVAKWFRPHGGAEDASAFDRLSDEYLRAPELREAVAQACRQHSAACIGMRPRDPEADQYVEARQHVAEQVWELLPELAENELSLVRIAVSALVSTGYQDLLAYTEGVPLFTGLGDLFAGVSPDERERRIRFVVEAMEEDIQSADTETRENDLEPWAAALYVLAVEVTVADDETYQTLLRRDPLTIQYEVRESHDHPEGQKDSKVVEAEEVRAFFEISQPLRKAIRHSTVLNKGVERLLALADQNTSLSNFPVMDLLACAYSLAGAQLPRFDTVWSQKFVCILAESMRRTRFASDDYKRAENLARYLLSPDGRATDVIRDNQSLRRFARMVTDPATLMETASEWLSRTPTTHDEAVTMLWFTASLLTEYEDLCGLPTDHRKRLPLPLVTLLFPVDDTSDKRSIPRSETSLSAEFNRQEVRNLLRDSLSTVVSTPWETLTRNECLAVVRTPGFYRDMAILATLYHSLLYLDDESLLDELGDMRSRVKDAARFAVQGLTIATRDKESKNSDPTVAQAIQICAYYGCSLLVIFGEGNRAISTILHAWRLQVEPGLTGNLACPETWKAVTKSSTASAVAWIAYHVFRGQYEHTRDSKLRHEFVLYCLKRFEKARKPRKTPPNAAEGWDTTRNEPSPLWRTAYVRALRELEGNPDGRVFKTLQAVSNRDASQDVRRESEQALETIGKVEGSYSKKSHRKAMLNAWLELRRVHMEALAQEIDEKSYEWLWSMEARE